ncbi:MULTISPECIES: helix-turn-helix domain-containing protein [Bacillus]|uniref:Helix-turn-helix domain-containing protein n=1 Tax=Bacillus toyonensis TaxID=155322 RepID=A0ABX6GE27_9BACI|nr:MULTISPECIES: helix-turn-helix transcriptional regulator [Bacillus cereus group]MED2708042.1 helix-turn-helix transcriptional regulator [Bacillus toyonensis]MED2736971.1 helix-turn-helix transcriptional regulator [Bacillus toyonensis]PFX55981.1 transcriptional regulator [Bacillus toyonensis]PHF36949.1 transcriptional regulator [Bacillus toyonensis]QHA19799.1 helix-turn-helix domain-containing protein [Bacillus toyonensis]
MSENNINIGAYIKGLREQKTMTISKLADTSKVSQPYLSQIEKGKRNPSLDIIRKLSKALEVDFYDLAWRAGFYTDEEMQERKGIEEYFNSMTPEEEAAYLEEENKSSKVEEYRRREYPDIKEVLEQSDVYFNGKSLNKEHRELAIKMLDVLFEKLEVNYPSYKEIEKKYDSVNTRFSFFFNQESSDCSKDK